jgi:signal transduction histidine kinase
MDSKNTPTLAAHPVLANWLKQQEPNIVPSWISAVQQTTATIQRGPKTRQMESAQLMEFFDSIVTAAQVGDTADLDVSIQALIANRLGRGYMLTDFLHVAHELKDSIWRAAWQKTQPSLSVEQALEILAALEPIFAHCVVQLAWLASRAAEAQLEEELERTRHTLAKLDRTKSDFISIAAHELKTPLTLVRGYTALLSNELAAQPRLQNVLTGLDNGIQRLQAIIKDMIDVSLIDSNVFTLALQSASLPEIIQLTVNDLERDASGRRVAVAINNFPSEVNSMYLDSQRIYQVFTNLIGNAIKYTPDGGKITLDARVLPIQDLKFVEVIITDTGIGIMPDDLPHIFDKFYRVGETELHSTSKTQFKGGGPGLGLAIVKGIVEAHGGRVWAESPGYDEERCPGSIFHIMLPIYKKPPARPSERLLGLE